MAQKVTRPVLTANDLSYIVEGLNLYASQWTESAIVAARQGDAEESGSLLTLGIEISDLEQRLRSLLDTMVSDTIDRQIADAMDEYNRQQDDSLLTDEVGTIPLPEPPSDEE